MPLEKSK